MRLEHLPNGYELTPDDDPRHLYENVLVALDEKRYLNNGEPAALAKWLGHLELGRGARFLHVGCGPGYYTAIAAVAVAPGGRVVGVEIDAELGARARENLRRYENAEVVVGDGSGRQGDLFDAILINAGATEPLPGWLDALAPGGRLLVPLTVTIPVMGVGMGQMLLIKRLPGGYSAGFVSPVGIFHCEGARTQEGEQLLRQAYERGDHQRVRRLRRDGHPVGDQCWLHATRFCLSCVSAGA